MDPATADVGSKRHGECEESYDSSPVNAIGERPSLHLPELRLDVVGVHVPAAVLPLVVPHGSLDPDARCAGYDSRDSLRRIGRRLPLLLAELDTSTGGRRGLSLQLAAETIRTDQLLREMYAVEFLHNCRVLQLETRVVPAVCPSSWAGPRSSRCHPPRFSTQ